MVQNVKLREVGKVIRILVGDFYHPLYLSKEFQNLLLKTSSTENPLKTSKSCDAWQTLNLYQLLNQSWENINLDSEICQSEKIDKLNNKKNID